MALSLALVGAAQPAAADTEWHVPVLMYHNVLSPSEMPLDERLPGLFVNPVLLDEQMAALRANGWHSITTRQLAQAMATGTAVPSKSIVISFDDGRPNDFTNAAPIVERYGFRATFFVVPGRIGTDQEMTATQIAQLAARGHEIANHTLDHVDLTSVSYDEARMQIRLAGDVIQDLTGLRPVALAYPYGPTDAQAQEAAADEGIQLAFVTDRGYGETWANRLDLHRVRVDGMIRLPDGSYGGGETAAGLLRSIAADSGRTDWEGPSTTPWPTGTLAAIPSATEPGVRRAGVVGGGIPPAQSSGPSGAGGLPAQVAFGVGLVAGLATLLWLVGSRRRRSQHPPRPRTPPA